MKERGQDLAVNINIDLRRMKDFQVEVSDAESWPAGGWARTRIQFNGVC